jgi:hypothetical protein
MTKTMLALGLMLAGVGCIADQMTLQPLFTEEDAVREPSLAGTWSSDDRDPLVLTIRATDEGYELRAIEKGVAGRPLAVRLGRIGSELYWDATAGADEAHQDVREEHLLRVHSLARIQVGAERLVVAPLSSKWVEAALADGTLETPYMMVDGDLLLTGSTTELQQLALQHGDDEGAFPQDPERASTDDDALVLRRVASDDAVLHPANPAPADGPAGS